MACPTCDPLFKCEQWVLAVILGSVGLLLLGVALPSHILVNTSGVYYLDSLGLGALVWGLLCPAYILSTLTARKQGSPAPCVVYDEEHLDVEKAFSAWPMSCMRNINFLVQLIRSVINVGSTAVVFYQLPERDPSEPLNAARYIVSWVELPIILMFVFQAILTTALGDVVKATSAFAGMREFSALRALALMDPMEFIGRIKSRCQSNGLVSAIGLALTAPVIVIAAVLALMIKVGQADFVATKVFAEWSWSNWLTFLGLAVNIGGIMPTTAKAISDIFSYVHPNEPDAEPLWRERLVSVLRARYGGCTAVVVYHTMSAADVAKLLRLEVRTGLV